MESLRKKIWKRNTVSASTLPESHDRTKVAASNAIQNEKEAHRWQAEQRTEVLLYTMFLQITNPQSTSFFRLLVYYPPCPQNGSTL